MAHFISGLNAHWHARRLSGYGPAGRGSSRAFCRQAQSWRHNGRGGLRAVAVVDPVDSLFRSTTDGADIAFILYASKTACEYTVSPSPFRSSMAAIQRTEPQQSSREMSLFVPVLPFKRNFETRIQRKNNKPAVPGVRTTGFYCYRTIGVSLTCTTPLCQKTPLGFRMLQYRLNDGKWR